MGGAPRARDFGAPHENELSAIAPTVRLVRNRKRTGGDIVKRFLIRAFLAGLPFGIVMGLFFSLIFGEGILPGLAVGVFFGVGMAAFQGRGKGNPPAFDGEKVLFQSLANHFRGVESVGGWLVLTDQRLLFQPHRLNIQKEEWSVHLSDLIRLEPRRTLGFLPNGLGAVTATGEERFVVEERMLWLREVGFAKSAGTEK